MVKQASNALFQIDFTKYFLLKVNFCLFRCAMVFHYLHYYIICTHIFLGSLVTPENVEEVMESIIKKLQVLLKRSREISNEVHTVMTEMRTEAERLTYGLFEEELTTSRSVSTLSNVATTTADSGFIAMVRTGLLALQLLPRNASLKIVVITDGMIAAPDINSLENLLAQLRKDTIALSFIKLSSTFYPHANLSRIPYEELMEYSKSNANFHLPKIAI